MLHLGPIAFAAPWLLGALLALPVVWWLLRLTPPVPRVVRFPAVRLLRDLVAREETPAHTPVWLLILRLLIGALVILGLARPVLHPASALPGSGPVALVVDDGWSAARGWPARQRLLVGLLTQAERQNREVAVVTTAPLATPGALKPQAAGPMPAADARRLIQGLEPRPWPSDRAAAAAAFRTLTLERAPSVIWLSDGVEDGGARALLREVQSLGGSVEVVADAPSDLPDLLLPPVTEGEALVTRLARAAPGPARTLEVRLAAGDDRLLALESATFAAGAATAEARFDLPLELRNQAVRLTIEGEATVGATVLLDERWRRRPVGLVASRAAAETQPLLGDLYYLERALAPFAEVRRGTIAELIKGDASVLILADIGALAADEAAALDAWLQHGGLLVRFAGPRLAHAPDALLPVRLRLGDRVLGGALSWAKPAHLAPFDPAGPFAGLSAPPDVTVERQVLAEPSLDTADRTWARLADGTPLVTADRRGQGSIVLVHTTANPDWSNLALSGLFVDMLRRLVALSAGVAGEGGTGALAPLELLDGLGRPGEPPATALPIPAGAFAETRVGPAHPPGFYGTSDRRRALNLTAAVTRLEPLGPTPGATRAGYARTGEHDLRAALLFAALALLLADMAIGLALRGLVAVPFLAIAVLLAPPHAAAAEFGDLAGRATAKTWLAYVVTGDAGVDQVSRAGLEGLAQVLNRRTAIDTGGVAAIDIERDELAFFPLLYWAVSPVEPPLSEAARRRVNDYLRHGGTILYDTRESEAGGDAAVPALRALTEGIELPPLTPVPADHVLAKSFYLLPEFPGRTVGGEVWIEAREGRRLDGVSPVIVGGNDWAGAWAIDAEGRPLHAVVPGGERQREIAYRFGVNVVMYALTGNYKADQVHVPAILQRIGQ